METNRIVPMRLFANWETDRASASAVQRMFTMSLSRLLISSFHDHQSTLVITVKLLGYKRTLRSNDFPVTASNGKLDVDLNIAFTIQYPHFLKRKANVLQILLQRRKRYKNRQIPGYKTLAVGTINLSEILQSGSLREIALFDPDSEKDDLQANNSCLGLLFVASCQSQAFEVENEVSVQRIKEKEMESEEEEESSTDMQYSENEQDLTAPDSARSSHKQRMKIRNSRQQKIAQRKNLKQKFASLLKKFRVPEEGGVGTTSHSGSAAPTAKELEELFEELDNLSDSGPEMAMDNLSIVSNPRPGLPPFFASTSSREVLPAITDDRVLSDESDEDWSSEVENTNVEREVENVNPLVPQNKRLISSGRGFSKGALSIESTSTVRGGGVTPSATTGSISAFSAVPLDSSSRNNRIAALSENKFVRMETISPKAISISDQLSAILKDEDPWTLSERVCICSLADTPVISLLDPSIHVLDCTTFNDCRLLISTVVGKIQKFCNSSSCSPHCTVLIVIGFEKLLNYVLRAYVETLQSKSTDWINFLRFCVIAPPWSAIGKAVGSLEGGTVPLRELFERPATDFTPAELKAIAEKLRGLAEGSVYKMPIGEAMLQLHGKLAIDEKDSCQLFIPFLSEVRIGQFDEESESVGGSPRVQDENQASPQTAFGAHSSPPSSPHSATRPSDSQDLQIEYWISSAPLPGEVVPYISGSTMGNVSASPAGAGSSAKKEAQSTKSSIRSAFRAFSIFRSPPSGLLSLQFVKEKKKDKMLQKLGMKKGQKSDSEGQSPSQCIRNVARLICCGKHPLNVWIDGTYWTGVRFFQTSALWQTHVKHFPICAFASDASHHS